VTETLTPLVCRQELPADSPAIRAVEIAAFNRPNEADLVDALRSRGGLTLSAVATLDGEIVGHIAYSPVTIESDRGSFNALALAPMAVLPDWQRQGVGSSLIEWSLNESRRAGHELVIVVGHPEFYSRFGFVPALPRGVRCPFAVPVEAFLVLELQPGALGGRAGMARYRSEFAAV
jgi:putative acetyltransferase